MGAVQKIELHDREIQSLLKDPALVTMMKGLAQKSTPTNLKDYIKATTQSKRTVVGVDTKSTAYKQAIAAKLKAAANSKTGIAKKRAMYNYITYKRRVGLE
jgi:hypothetical protein